MKGLNWKKIFTGFAFYIIAFGMIECLFLYEFTPDVLVIALNNAFIALGYTSAVAATSGYLAAGNNVAFAVRNSAVCGFLIVSSAFFWAAKERGLQDTSWLNVWFWGLSVEFLCALLGGCLRLRHITKRNNRVIGSASIPLP